MPRPCALALLLGTLAAPLAAQAPRAGGPWALALRPTTDSVAPSPPVSAPPVSVRGTPHSFQVVAVPVPEQLPPNAAVSYRILSSGITPILGAPTGTLPPGSKRTLLLTLAVPGRARAGDLSVAAVRFHAENGPEFEVPILVNVAVVEGIELSVSEALRAVHPGEQSAVSFRITNAGNAPDTVSIQVLPPPSWEVMEPLPAERIPLPTHGLVDRVLRFRAPEGAHDGRETIRLMALSHGHLVATAELTVEVMANGTSAAADGPLLRIGAATARGPWNGTSAAVAAELEGPVADGVRLYARGTTLSRDIGTASYGFALAGVYAMPLTVRLTASSWQAGFGLTGATFSSLSGVNAAGRGVSGTYQHERIRATALAARSDLGSTAGSGSLLGAQLSFPVGPVELSTTATHLVEPGSDGRQLDALALGATAPDVFDGQLSAELADRRFAAGSGFGWATSYERRTGHDAFQLRLGHAPGGSAAFARATDELSASVSRQVAQRVTVTGSLWRTRDQGRSSFGRLSTDGWSMGTLYQLSPVLGLGLDWRRSSFGATGDAGVFGSDESVLSTSAHLHRGGWFGDGKLYWGRSSRLTTTQSGTDFTAAAPRSGAQASFGVTTRHGTFQATSQIEQSSQAIGQFPLQGEFGLEAQHVPLIRAGAIPVYLQAAVSQYTWFGDRSGATMLRLGASADLPADFSVTLAAERNPFFTGSNGRQGWIVALKLERALHLRQPIRRQTRGVVYSDLNGNGRRDVGEPGVAGVVMRLGDATAVSGSDGRYSFTGDRHEAPTVDVRSLPAGVIAGSEQAGTDGGVGLTKVAAVTVRLRLAAEDSARVPSQQLGAAIVMAHDTGGRTWVARATAPGSAVFDALPPGRYTVDLDLADIAEPLRTEGPPATFTVGAAAPPVVVIELHARPIHLRVLPAPDQPTPDSAAAKPAHSNTTDTLWHSSSAGSSVVSPSRPCSPAAARPARHVRTVRHSTVRIVTARSRTPRSPRRCRGRSR